MHYKKMLVGDYIAAIELDDKQPTLTIKGIKSEQLEAMPKAGSSDDEGASGNGAKKEAKKKKKWIVFFKETDRGWVLNRTNILCLAAMFGEESDGWIGKRVTIFAQMVQVGRKKEPGIRIKGSPDITGAVSATIELPRRRPFQMRLVPTGKGAPSEPEPTGGVVGEDVDPPIPPDDAPPVDEREAGWEG